MVPEGEKEGREEEEVLMEEWRISRGRKRIWGGDMDAGRRRRY